MQKTLLPSVFTVLLVCCALVITALVIRREFFLDETKTVFIEDEEILTEVVWQAASGFETREQGSLVKQVTIVVFYDYECSFCREIHPTLVAIQAKYPYEVGIIYRHLLIPYHNTAYPAAVAAECSAAQGYFQVYHAELFARQDALAHLNWVQMARRVGVPDLALFQRCLTHAVPADKIKADYRLAEDLGIDEIPTIIVNGKLFTGVLSVAQLDVIVQRELAQKY